MKIIIILTWNIPESGDDGLPPLLSLPSVLCFR